jgi:hypothetical protein
MPPMMPRVEGYDQQSAVITTPCEILGYVPATLEMKMTRPQFAVSMAGMQSWVRRYAEPQFVRQFDSKVEMETSAMLAGPVTEEVVPALLMSMLGGPRLVVMCL